MTKICCYVCSLWFNVLGLCQCTKPPPPTHTHTLIAFLDFDMNEMFFLTLLVTIHHTIVFNYSSISHLRLLLCWEISVLNMLTYFAIFWGYDLLIQLNYHPKRHFSPWGFKVIGHSCLVTKLLEEGQLPEEGHHLYDVEDYGNKPSLTVRLKYSQQRRKRIK